MRITQTNGTDTATFDRPDPPLVAGGQGRTADSLTDTLKVCGWLMLVVLQVGAVVCAVGIINAVAGPLVTAIAVLCCVVVGANCYGIGRIA